MQFILDTLQINCLITSKSLVQAIIKMLIEKKEKIQSPFSV